LEPEAGSKVLKINITKGANPMGFTFQDSEISEAVPTQINLYGGMDIREVPAGVFGKNPLRNFLTGRL
jgi:hypothetical protein